MKLGTALLIGEVEEVSFSSEHGQTTPSSRRVRRVGVDVGQ